MGKGKDVYKLLKETEADTTGDSSEEEEDDNVVMTQTIS